MITLTHLTQQSVRVGPTGADALSCMTLRANGLGDRGGVGAGLRLGVRLDTDPQTDPLHDLTAQVSAPNSASRSIQTDPVWGLPRRGVREHIR